MASKGTGDNKVNSGSYSVSSVIFVAESPVVHPLITQTTIPRELIIRFHALQPADSVSSLSFPEPVWPESLLE